MYRSFQILLIEDDANDRALIAHELSTRLNGVRVCSESEASGIAVALERGGFDLVITDYDLGWTNGLVLLKEFKAHWPSIPVIVCSGNPSADLARRAIEIGAIQFVEKCSSGFPQLLRAVENVWSDCGRK